MRGNNNTSAANRTQKFHQINKKAVYFHFAAAATSLSSFKADLLD